MGTGWIVHRGTCQPKRGAGVARYSINHNYDLWKITLDEKRMEKLTTFGGPEFCPRISPDGKRIVCLSSPRKGPHRDIFNLVVIELTAKGPQARVVYDHHASPDAKPPHLPPEYPLPDPCCATTIASRSCLLKA